MLISHGHHLIRGAPVESTMFVLVMIIVIVEISYECGHQLLRKGILQRVKIKACTIGIQGVKVTGAMADNVIRLSV